MTKIRVDELHAAQRQVDAGIRMLFSGEEPIAILTLASTAFRILRDLTNKSSDSYMQKVIRNFLVQGKEKEFWKQWNTASNFLKHADRDPDAISDGIEEEACDGELFLASFYYHELANQFTTEMIVLVAWYTAIHPNFIREDTSADFKNIFINLGEVLKNETRREQLAEGANLIKLAKNQMLTR